MQDNSISVSYEPFDQLLSNATIQDQKLAQDIFMKLSQLSQVQDDIEIRLQKLQNTKWSIAENDLFLKALETFSFTDTEGIQKIVQTKTQKQLNCYVCVKTHRKIRECVQPRNERGINHSACINCCQLPQKD
ncbi:Homeobox-like_domain superfamily [Hexamita inflata]|uniref:Homeobox-like domain superfamily n=1 Tax=Hexamita inflata TaxID=28002 RepID=A0AA86Q330_9EUKA|nr:Homeobox-like domain superfamily [Hexamita inflata]